MGTRCAVFSFSKGTRPIQRDVGRIDRARPNRYFRAHTKKLGRRVSEKPSGPGRCGRPFGQRLRLVVRAPLGQHDPLDPAPGTPPRRPGAQPGPGDRPGHRRRPSSSAGPAHTVVGLPALFGGRKSSATGPAAGAQRRCSRPLTRSPDASTSTTPASAPGPGRPAQAERGAAGHLASGTWPAPPAPSFPPVMTLPHLIGRLQRFDLPPRQCRGRALGPCRPSSPRTSWLQRSN